MTYYVYTARLLAYRIAESLEEDLPQEDFDVLEQVWTRLDRYNAWATECLALANTSTAEGDASMTLSALKVCFSVCLSFEPFASRADSEDSLDSPLSW